jgi:signal transduction histidine kinase/CheY-like chemotaxis protein/HPt (histidine-containing phosphotransfer) domain-containing protein
MLGTASAKWLPILVWMATLLLAAATWAAVIQVANHDRQGAFAGAKRDSGNLTHIIAEQAARTIADTDSILSFLAFDIGHLSANRPSLKDVLTNATSGSDLLLQVAYTDAKGDVIETSVGSSTGNVNLADREHFLVHQRGLISGLYISRPVLGRVSGKWSIQLSRRISRPDGSFDGIMIASIDPFYFSHTFDNLDVGRNGLVSILNRDGSLLARTRLNDKTIGRDMSSTLPYRAAMVEPQGFMVYKSAIDGIKRLVSYRTIANYPLIIVAGFDAAEVFAESNARRKIFFVGASAATMMLLIIAVLVGWYARVQHQARAGAERANRMKSEFVATISHELRTPMNGVLGMLELLENDEITTGQRRYAATARRSAEGLLALLDDILDFSRLEAGRTVINTEDCRPAQISNEVADLLRPNAGRKGLALSVVMTPSVPETVVTDPARLRQIMFNLLGNAIKFTSSGSVSLRAQRGADLPDDRFLLEFEVEDTGIGIRPEVIPTLFHHFTQADSSITRSYGGSGLGLAISKRLCELMGGGISVSSTPGKGSLFRFTVAASQSDTPPSGSQPLRAADAVSVLPPLHVLVADDNSVNQQVVGGLLNRAGHSVVIVDDGGAAVAAVSTTPRRFDVVLMDVQMPRMDGLTATRQIRALQPPLNSVPIIALTAHASSSSSAACLDAGMNGYAKKPIRLQQLLDEIARVLTLAPDRPAAAAETVSPEGLLDLGQIAELTGSLSPESWDRIVASFSEAADAEIARIIDAIDSDQSPRAFAHTLKGVAWNTGALRLGNLARELETASAADAKLLASELRPLRLRSIAALTAATLSHAGS